MRTSSKGCGRSWEEQYWKETIEKWEVWDEGFKVGLVNKWIELCRTKDKDCLSCGKTYANMKVVKPHVRMGISCYEGMVKLI